MSGAKGLPVAAISRRPTQDGDAAVLGRSDELKMKARMRARFWEENDEQTDERVALDHIEGFDQRREEKEKKQTLEKREEERLQRQKQKAENDKERVREVIQREKARRDMRQLQDFLKDNEHSLMGEDEERTKAMKLAAALLFRDFETPRAIVNALHRSNLNLQSQQSIFKFVNQALAL